MLGNWDRITAVRKDAGKAIKRARLAKGMTLFKLGKKVGKAASYLSMIETGKRKPPLRLARKIGKALDLSPTALCTGSTGMTVSLLEAGESLPPAQKVKFITEMEDVLKSYFPDKEDQPVRARAQIPVISSTAAGDPVAYTDPFPKGIADEYVHAPEDLGDENAFALTIRGDSMEPKLSDGDIVIVCPNWELRGENIVVVVKVKDAVTCKRLSRKDDTVVLSSLNPAYPPQIVRASEVEWIYPVARAITNLYK